MTSATIGSMGNSDENLDEIVSLRNTISGVAMEVTRRYANAVLAHPTLGEINEIVRTPKPEVLKNRNPDTDGYAAYSKESLVTLADERNSGREDADKIDASGSKEDLIAALTADDESN